MKPRFAIAITGAVLLAGASVASASLFASSPQAGDSLTLSAPQQKTAWNDLSRAPASNAPSSFQPTTSSALPSTVAVRAIPDATARDVPALGPYDYAKTDGKLLIVNPRDMMIAEVIAE